ncbi:MAG: phosphoribosylamine--glycine ligase [Acidimicrobiales bacterium]
MAGQHGQRMRVCVVGQGGREHALAVALGRTCDVRVAPGNPGMDALGVACDRQPAEDIDADLFVIGPEAPLVDGLADRLRTKGKLVLGPGADGARLEGSKAWMKDVLSSASIPTAAYGVFDEPGPAIEFLRSLAPPWVVKTDGLAAGKGVFVTDDLEAACSDVAAKLSGRAFGAAGRRVVIEEGLTGPELSVMAVCDGTRAVALAPAQDFKRACDDDRGPNTGGIGAYSPVPVAPPEVVAEVMDRAVLPTLAALSGRGIDFRGVLYAGLMLTAGGPKVLEFNVRFGDPEIQVVLPRWEGDVGEVLAAAAAGRLDTVAPPAFSSNSAVCVVLAAPGYPGSPRTGEPISGMMDADGMEGVRVYAAGVGEGLTTSGGRVLNLTAVAPTLAEARARVYEAVPAVHWPGIHYRTDIAERAAAVAALLP